MQASEFLNLVRGKLIVSCQALEDEPLHGADIMARMALAAMQGGAVAIRANSPEDIRAIKQAVDLPVIGLYKDGTHGVYITPTLHHARQVAESGAEVIALDATQRPRPDGSTVQMLVRAIHDDLGKLVLADVSTLEEAQLAQEAGADFIAPTLAGYTGYSTQLEGPDFDLIRAMVAALKAPIIAEGRIHTPEDARAVLDLGVAAVVVGSAITRPQLITARFAKALTNR